MQKFHEDSANKQQKTLFGVIVTNLNKKMEGKTFPVPDDIRFAEIFVKEEGKEQDFFGDLVLLGFPYDIGVSRNGGRVGACEGPASVRK